MMPPSPSASRDDEAGRTDNAFEDRNTPRDIIPEISSQELMRGQREILIRHGQDVYRLRITRNGKLILHK